MSKLHLSKVPQYYLLYNRIALERRTNHRIKTIKLLLK